MTPQTLVAVLFAALAAIFIGLWLLAELDLRRCTAPARRAYLRIAVIFMLVSTWLFYWP